MLRLFTKQTVRKDRVVSIRTYKAQIQQLHHDGVDYNQQSVEIKSDKHIRRCTFYKTICPNVRTLGKHSMLIHNFHN